MKNKKKLKCDMNPWQCLRLLIAITIIVFPLGIPTELLGQDVNHLYQQAGEAIQKGRLQDAAAIFERAAQLRPGDAEPLIGIAFTYIHLNRLQEAITILNRALAINPNSSEAHTNMGFAHWRMGNRDRAVQEYSIAIRMDPSNSQAHYNLGNSYLAMGSPATAIPFLEKAVQLQPNHMDALVTLGAARINMGDPAGAMKPLRRAVSLDPNRADTRYNLGLALGRSGYMSEAAKEFSWLETNNKEFALRLRQQLGDAVVRARLPIGDVPIPESLQEEDDSSISLLGQTPHRVQGQGTACPSESSEWYFYLDNNDNPADNTYLECRYHSDGRLQFQIPFVDGKMEGVKLFYDISGNDYFLAARSTHIDGKEHGITEIYSVTNPWGTYFGRYISLKTPYVNGQRHGVQETYSLTKDGRYYLERKTPYVNNRIHGVVTHYDPSGRIEKTEQYNNGKRLGAGN